MQNESNNKLDKCLHILNNELKNNNIKIELLTEENKNIKNKIHKILKIYSDFISIFLKLGSLLFIITGIGIIGALSNFNLIIMLLFSIASPITCIFMNIYLSNMLNKRYRKKNNKIISLDCLINENNNKITELRKVSVKLLGEILANSKTYNHPKVIISSTLNATTIMKENDNKAYTSYINKKHNLKRVKKLNKIKTRKQ